MSDKFVGLDRLEYIRYERGVRDDGEWVLLYAQHSLWIFWVPPQDLGIIRVDQKSRFQSHPSPSPSLCYHSIAIAISLVPFFPSFFYLLKF
jgi:hypothetical protein